LVERPGHAGHGSSGLDAEAVDRGEDMGHYGRLVFAMIGRQFVSNDELVELLTKDHDPDACNPYAELRFPDEVYEAIQEYREERT
jgi:hypothetical protein